MVSGRMEARKQSGQKGTAAEQAERKGRWNGAEGKGAAEGKGGREHDGGTGNVMAEQRSDGGRKHGGREPPLAAEGNGMCSK